MISLLVSSRSYGNEYWDSHSKIDLGDYWTWIFHCMVPWGSRWQSESVSIFFVDVVWVISTGRGKSQNGGLNAFLYLQAVPLIQRWQTTLICLDFIVWINIETCLHGCLFLNLYSAHSWGVRDLNVVLHQSISEHWLPCRFLWKLQQNWFKNIQLNAKFSHYFTAPSLKKLPLIQLAVGGRSL